MCGSASTACQSAETLGRHFGLAGPGLLGVGGGAGSPNPYLFQHSTPLAVMASPLKLEQDVLGKVDSFRARIAQEAEDLVSTFFPQKLS